MIALYQHDLTGRSLAETFAANDSLFVRLEVRESLDRRLYSASVAGPAGTEVELADRIVMQLLRWFHPELLAKYGPRPTWGLNAAALAEFLQGDAARSLDANEVPDE